MADQLCLPQLDPYHLFVISINGVLHKDATVYGDREFEMILDQYDGYLPRNLRAYHFSSKAGPGPTIKETPTLSIPVYKLGRSSSAVPSGLRLHSKNGLHSGMAVERQQFDFVWTKGPSAGGLIAYIDGIEYSLLSQYRTFPITFQEAAEYVNNHHRHNIAPQGHKFSIAVCSADGYTVGVLIASEPKARHLQDGRTLEINRCCTDFRYHNVCSTLLSKAIRIGKEMGYQRFISYTLESEQGASLKAVGFHVDGITKGRMTGWDAPSRHRNLADKYPTENKKRWLLEA